MLALTVSAALVAYVFIPGILFRLFFSLFIPLEKFQRTRSEELTFGAFTTLLPLAVTLLLVLNVTWFGNHPFCFQDSSAQKVADYTVVASSLYSETYFAAHQKEFWDGSTRIAQRQGRVLIWLYVFTSLESGLFGWLGLSYGRLRKSRVYAWVAERFLIPNISSWYVILTTFLWPKEPERKVVADLLTSDDHLYRGEIAGYEMDHKGDLRGLLLTDVLRFDRHSYLQDKDSGSSPNKEAYWKEIPGKNLFVFADKLSTMNLSYIPPASIFPGVLERVLKRLKIEAKVTMKQARTEPPKQ